MLFKTIASFLAAAVASAATPSTIIRELASLPVYEGRKSFHEGLVDVRVRVAFKVAPAEDYDVGKADFLISIVMTEKGSKRTKTLSRECHDEDVELLESVLRFDPFTDEGVTCTRELIEAVNAEFGSSVPTPVELAISEGASMLTFQANIKGADIVVPMRRH